MASFESILEALEIPDFIKRSERINQITEKVYSSQFNTGEIKQLEELAKEQFTVGAASAGSGLLNLVACGGPSKPLSRPDCLFLRYADPEPLRNRVTGVEKRFLQQYGVIGTDEAYLITDVGYLFLGNSRSYRVGGISLTNKNIVVIGPYDNEKKSDTRHHLFYEVSEDKWYVPSMDVIDLSRISDIRFEWNWSSKRVRFTYRTKYYQTKGSTLYGPLFFKLELPAKTKLLEGDLEVSLMLADVPWSKAPKGFTRMRLEELFEGIKRAKSELDTDLL